VIRTHAAVRNDDRSFTDACNNDRDTDVFRNYQRFTRYNGKRV